MDSKSFLIFVSRYLTYTETINQNILRPTANTVFHHINKTIKTTNNMNFTPEELETIKQALIVSLSHSEELDDESAVITLLDRIDEEAELD